MSESTQNNTDKNHHTILLVDDDEHIRRSLCRALTLQGYAVAEVGSGPEALAYLKQERVDLMLLDMRLPGMDGLQIAERAAQTQPDMAIVILTANPTVESAIAAIRLDPIINYFIKPVSMAELTQGIQEALQKRARQAQQTHLFQVVSHTIDTMRQMGQELSSPPALFASAHKNPDTLPIHLNTQTRIAIVASRPDHSVELTEGEAAVLTALINAADHVLSCRQLVRHSLGYQDVDEIQAQSVIRPYIFRLRRKIELDPQNPTIIRTVRGRGYMLNAVHATFG
ncbi:MAG: response regulator transcription factor [Anaerolineales bacterium]|nr:response regulator transcription factor [Anaerolineales bacterium]MCB8950771.1 response regulator transcription factor [Ardenticatenales bacterium]